MISPLGTIGDYDDVRIFKKAAEAALKRAVKAGIKRPLLVLSDHPLFEQAALVTLLGALQALYTVSYKFQTYTVCQNKGI